MNVVLFGRGVFADVIKILRCGNHPAFSRWAPHPMPSVLVGGDRGTDRRGGNSTAEAEF